MWIDVLTRMKKGLENIMEIDNSEILIIVLHADPLTILRNYLAGGGNNCLFDSEYYLLYSSLFFHYYLIYRYWCFIFCVLKLAESLSLILSASFLLNELK